MVFGARCLENKLCDHHSLRRQCGKLSTFLTHFLLYWKKINGTGGISKMEREIAYTPKTTAFLQDFFGDRIIWRGVVLHDHQTLRRLTPFCVDFIKK
jgi:hypothetical protein